LLPIVARQTTNGYDLTLERPIPYGRYLLLVRERKDAVGRASGYFVSDTNSNPIHLHVEPNGMMAGGQQPIAMPVVQFPPLLVDPEFAAGWGEDSDGDGLPDIYEVLVTQTDPVNLDTGNAGLLDGYKDPDHDGWSSLEEFRRRTNPLEAESPPRPIELKQPTLLEATKAMVVQGDLPYELRVQIRQAGAAYYEPLNRPLYALYSSSNFRDRTSRGSFDLLITLRVPDGPSRRPD
jgi:hypothetical protein